LNNVLGLIFRLKRGKKALARILATPLCARYTLVGRCTVSTFRVPVRREDQTFDLTLCV
jgi:hypothetical protein